MSVEQFQDLLAQYFDDRLRETAGDEHAYRQALEEKAAAMRSGNSPDSGRLLALEEKLAQQNSRSERLFRTIENGQLGHATAYDILNDLSRLNFQMYPGSRMNRLAHACELVRSIQDQDMRLQKELQRFKDGLENTGLRFDLKAEVGLLVRSERAALDMLFAEDEVLGKAMYAAERMQALLNALPPLLAQLEQMHRQACAECAQTEKQRLELIARARFFRYS